MSTAAVPILCGYVGGPGAGLVLSFTTVRSSHGGVVNAASVAVPGARMARICAG